MIMVDFTSKTVNIVIEFELDMRFSIVYNHWYNIYLLRRYLVVTSEMWMRTVPHLNYEKRLQLHLTWITIILIYWNNTPTFHLLIVNCVFSKFTLICSLICESFLYFGIHVYISCVNNNGLKQYMFL